jgi:hypothetical protein
MKTAHSHRILRILLGAGYVLALGGVAWLFARYVPYGLAWFVGLITLAAMWNPGERPRRESRLKPVRFESPREGVEADRAGAESHA